MQCRICGSQDFELFVDLGHQPPSNSLLTKEQLGEPETYYPLKVFVCKSCWLVQMPEYKKAREIFDDQYPYYSSQSPSNVVHAKEYVEMMCERFRYGKDSKVLEIGSNDGYLLQHFKGKVSARLGIEPSSGPASLAIQNGIPTTIDYFNSNTAFLTKLIYGGFDLVCGINVLAHQPDLNDFVEGIRIALKPDGVCTMEFPYLGNLVDECQFDTIYHEHYSYFSLSVICNLFERHQLRVWDVDKIPEHGGSLRVYVQHVGGPHFSLPMKADVIINRENAVGMNDLFYYSVDYYGGFQPRIQEIKYNLVNLLVSIPRDKTIMAYGAAAKGNTLLNYCGIGKDIIPYVADISPHKQGLYLPGSHIEIVGPERIKEFSPDYVLILPWNIKDEIMKQLSYIRDWGGEFIIPIPNVEVI